MPSRPPVVIKLGPSGFVLAIGDATLMVRLQRFDVDPATDPNALGTDLAAMIADHHAQVTPRDDEPRLVGPPMYFVRTRGGPGNLKLHPPCDKTYWFRATFRPLIKFGKPPATEE
jgi:hypothetical protein